MTKLSEKHLAFMFGVVFVIVLLTLATLVPNPTPFQYTVFRIVLALAAGGVAAMIPGFLTVNVPNILRAGGALAVFVVVYFYSPAALTGVKVKTEQEVELEKPILHLKEGTRHFPPLVLVATAFAQESSSLSNLVVSSRDQLKDPATWGKRYQVITIDGVRAEAVPGSVLVANEILAVRGGALVGRDVTVVARRIANLEVDASGSQSPLTPTGRVRLYAKTVENSRVLANGAAGIAGLPGAPGADGVDGSNGRDGSCEGFGGYRGAGAGGNGGDGANGENGNPGTEGQAGGLVLVTAIIVPISSTIDVSGGLGGPGGLGGAAGSAGRPGVGGRGCTGLGGSQSSAKDGASGRPGRAGIAGSAGAAGNAGEYRLVLVRSFNEIVSKVNSMSNAQLHAAL